MNDRSRPRQPRPRKRFGQHFLVDQAVIEQIFAALRLSDDDHVIEVGPGHGALTARLLEEAGSVAAIEIDRDLAARLSARFPSLQLETADVLRIDLGEFARRTRAEARRVRIVGNLPYNVATPLIGRLFELAQPPDASPIADIHVMLQREVADRLTAPLGSPDYGRLTVMAQYHCQVERLFDVDRTSFRPPPKVRSAFVRLLPRQDPPPCDLEALAQVLRTAFSKRRKTIANALAPLTPNWQELGLEPTLRPQELSVANYIALARQFASRPP